MGFVRDRTHRNFTDEDISKISETYHNWRKNENYENIKGFCKSATLEEIQKTSHVFTPGRYVGIPEEEDDGVPFQTKRYPHFKMPVCQPACLPPSFGACLHASLPPSPPPSRSC